MTTALVVAGIVAWLACAPLSAYLSDGAYHRASAKDDPMGVLLAAVVLGPALVLMGLCERASERGERKGGGR